MFNPDAFVTNLKYMGIGMLGVFIIIGIIIIATYAINKFTNK
ncbi:MAG: oxaloacetate decarboxylase [Clostridia bacterium]|nr:oxaloacetate decarboxylase [Clostridia bacterium]